MLGNSHFDSPNLPNLSELPGTVPELNALLHNLAEEIVKLKEAHTFELEKLTRKRSAIFTKLTELTQKPRPNPGIK